MNWFSKYKLIEKWYTKQMMRVLPIIGGAKLYGLIRHLV